MSCRSYTVTEIIVSIYCTCKTVVFVSTEIQEISLNAHYIKPEISRNPVLAPLWSSLNLYFRKPKKRSHCFLAVPSKLWQWNCQSTILFHFHNHFLVRSSGLRTSQIHLHLTSTLSCFELNATHVLFEHNYRKNVLCHKL